MAVARGRVKVGRRVGTWVNERGGNLYVWTERFGRGASWHAKADTDGSPDVEFDRYEGVYEFKLWLERDATFSNTLRLNRRWFGLRDGIVVTGGLALLGDLAPLGP